MLEHNRNLSSIVGAIQDEGPPASVIRDMKNAAGSVEAGASDPARTDRQRSVRRVFLYLLLATLVLAAGLIFIIGSRDGYLANFTYGAGQYIQGFSAQEEHAVSSMAGEVNPARAVESVEPAVVGERNVHSDILEIHERQAVIMKRLEELTAAMADLKVGNDQYRVENQGKLKAIQEDFQGEIDNIAAAVAGLQAGPAHQEGISRQLPEGSSDVGVTQPEPATVPASGGWVVNVANSGHLQAIEKLQKKLRKHGIQTEIQKVTINGKASYRLRIPGFSTRDEARDYGQNLDGDLGLKGPWVSKR